MNEGDRFWPIRRTEEERLSGAFSKGASARRLPQTKNYLLPLEGFDRRQGTKVSKSQDFAASCSGQPPSLLKFTVMEHISLPTDYAACLKAGSLSGKVGTALRMIKTTLDCAIALNFSGRNRGWPFGACFVKARRSLAVHSGKCRVL